MTAWVDCLRPNNVISAATCKRLGTRADTPRIRRDFGGGPGCCWLSRFCRFSHRRAVCRTPTPTSSGCRASSPRTPTRPCGRRRACWIRCSANRKAGAPRMRCTPPRESPPSMRCRPRPTAYWSSMRMPARPRRRVSRSCRTSTIRCTSSSSWPTRAAVYDSAGIAAAIQTIEAARDRSAARLAGRYVPAHQPRSARASPRARGSRHRHADAGLPRERRRRARGRDAHHGRRHAVDRDAQHGRLQPGARPQSGEDRLGHRSRRGDGALRVALHARPDPQG